MNKVEAINIIRQYVLSMSELPCEVKEALPYFTVENNENLWTEEKIRSSVNEFVKREGRCPTPDDFRDSNFLPSGNSVKRITGVSLSAWLSINFGYSLHTGWLYKLGHLSKTDIKNMFIKEYLSFMPKGRKDYKKHKSSSAPPIELVFSVLEVNTWDELKSTCGLKEYDFNPLRDFSISHKIVRLSDKEVHK